MRLSSWNRRITTNRQSGPRLRKKHKRLDAICEEEYNRNHVEPNEGDGGGDGMGELRRSSRVRRAPVLLDVSPPPAKKRRKIGNSVMFIGEKIVKSDSSPVQSPGSADLGGVETPGSWKSRLRSRGRNVGFGVKEERGSPSGKRKLFEEKVEIREEEEEEEEVVVVRGGLDEKKEELGGGKSTVVKSKRPGRVKVENDLREGEKENELKVKSDGEEVEVIGDMGDDEGRSVLESGMGGRDDIDIVVDGNATELVEEEERGTSVDLRLEEGCVGNDNVVTMELSDNQVEQLECGKEGESQSDDVEVVGILAKEGEGQNDDIEVIGISANQVDNGGSHDGNEADLAKVNEIPSEDQNAKKVDKSKCALSDTLGKPRVKEGRRCGLCGGGTDGKPPKRLIQNSGESENEAYSGSSASEEPNYDLWDGFGDEPGWLGRLLGPINDRYGIAGIWVHQHCAVWSPEVWFLTHNYFLVCLHHKTINT